MKYLIEIRVKFEVKVRALDHCHDIVSKLGFAQKRVSGICIPHYFMLYIRENTINDRNAFHLYYNTILSDDIEVKLYLTSYWIHILGCNVSLLCCITCIILLEQRSKLMKSMLKRSFMNTQASKEEH